MKTKVVQHVESEWVKEKLKECESERVTFEHRHGKQKLFSMSRVRECFQVIHV